MASGFWASVQGLTVSLNRGKERWRESCVISDSIPVKEKEGRKKLQVEKIVQDLFLCLPLSLLCDYRFLLLPFCFLFLSP